MLAVDETLATVTDRWLARLECALIAGDEGALGVLFVAESYWRDVLALTWRIQTVSGAGNIASELGKFARERKPRSFGVDPERTPPRVVTRAGTSCIEAIFHFEMAEGPASGVVRLEPERDEPRAWTFLTALEDLKGHEERVGEHRPLGSAYSRDFGGPNWLDQRREKQRFDKQEPTVLVVGGGQAGLSIGARLTQRGIDTLIVDRWPRVGDNWRQRYHALTLHNQVHVNHLPYMPFPPNWPVYIPKDKLANWFEAYVEAMELNYWTGTEFLGGCFDSQKQTWNVQLKRDGKERVLHPKHVVMATGVSGIPNIPDIPELRAFSGKILHASEYIDGEDWKGKKAVVIGTGNSGHDIAQDLYSGGAKVTLVQRSPTLIIQCEPSAQLVYSLYSEGPPLEDCDLITVSVPWAVARTSHRLATRHARELDQPLLKKLAGKGFRLTFGEDDTGWQFMYLNRGGGYYFNVGCSNLIAEGKIDLEQVDELPEVLQGADLVVLATGYKGLESMVAQFFGDEIARRIGPIWGFGPEDELRNMFVRTPQPGLWFIAGSFAQCRIYSKYLALQIHATELGLLAE
ncbi:MAG TPA: NAD(P)/FAD-dependent oxidoreductase [Chloroflexota bacterium]|nr:NAD(P)/FAD-dependent oxidoreductase [Chloroflexota bacterium]